MVNIFALMVDRKLRCFVFNITSRRRLQGC